MKKILSFFLDKSLLIFLIIGGLNTVISMLGSQLLYGVLGYWGSSAVMFALCSIFSFIFNRKYSFESKAPVLQSAVRFSIVIAVCYGVAFGAAQPLVNWAANAFVPSLDAVWKDRIAMLVAQVIFTGCNYIGQRLWAFREEKTP